MTAKKAPPPTGLGSAGRKLWQGIADQVHGDGLEMDAPELRVLRDAARTADELEQIEAALVDAPVTVVGSTGQPVPNRLYDEARKHRALIATLLRQLDLTSPEDRAGGRGSRTTSASARAAASVRWHGSGSGIGGA